MLTVKVKYELELTGKAADDLMQAWCECESPEEVALYFDEYLKDRRPDELKVVSAHAEWRPDND